MKSMSLLALLAIAAASPCLHAQEMNVVRQDGQVDQFSLADVDSLTFDAQALLAGRSVTDVLQIHTHDGVVQVAVAGIDSLTFASGNQMTVYQASGVANEFNLASVDSLTFASGSQNVVTVTYAGATASVDNPLAGAGVAVAITGGDVVVTSTIASTDVVYALSGTTPSGMFKIYSLSDFALRLSGVQITNLDGPAINIQADVTIPVELTAGTTSTLTDGVAYVTVPGEDQKAAFFSEGQLVFGGEGSLIIHGQGTSQHGLASDDYIHVAGGDIVIQSTVRDGIHTNEGFFLDGGSVEVTATSDGIDGGDGPIEIAGGEVVVHGLAADTDAIKCDGLIRIAGGAVDLTVPGNQAKGLNSPDVELSGGDLTIHTTGGVVLEASGSGFDPSYCTAIKADDTVLLDGCHLVVTATGIAGRGISSTDIVIESGTVSITSSGNGGTYVDETGVTDAYAGHCLNADGDVSVLGGTVTLTASGSGAKGINGDSDLTIGTAATVPVLTVATTGAQISIGGGEYVEAKAVSVDSLITVDNGQISLRSPDDALKAKVRIDINGGLINVLNSMEGIEAPNIYVNGGEIHVNSTDDGVNATYGVDGEFNDGSILTINGGYLHVNAPAGDGVDSNGILTINGGTVIVHGPPNQPEVGLDVNGTFRVNGSFTIVSQINGSMIETPSGQSTQRCVMFRRTSGTLAGGTLFHVEDASGNTLVTFAPARTYSCILLSSPNIVAGTTYRVYTGGTCTGTVRDGLYSGGTYSGGTLRATFTSTTMVQSVNF